MMVIVSNHQSSRQTSELHGGVAPTCTYTRRERATNTSGGRWGIYNNRRSNTSKGWGFPKKGAPLSHTSYWISRPFGLDSAVTAFRAVTLGAAWDVGMACNVFKLLELLWPHSPDVQTCTSMLRKLSDGKQLANNINESRLKPFHERKTEYSNGSSQNLGEKQVLGSRDENSLFLVEDIPSKGICLRALKTFIYCNPEQEVLDCLYLCDARALADIVNHSIWGYVVTINSGDIYGQVGINSFQNKFENVTLNRCVAGDSIEIPYPREAASDYDAVVAALYVSNATVVVLFMASNCGHELFEFRNTRNKIIVHGVYG
ncbi:hypothetical protein EMCRGX_G009300 [Ephydatia muelleri]